MARANNIYANNNISQIGSWEPKQTNRFLCTLWTPPINALVPGADFPPVVYTNGSYNRQLITMVKTTKRPDFNVSDSDTMVNFLHEQSIYAGKPKVANSIDVTFRDATGPRNGNYSYDVMGTLYEWARLVYDPYTGTMGFKTEYEGTMLLDMLDPHGDIIESWTFWRLWPKNITGGNLSTENAGEAECTVSFNYDKVYKGRMIGNGLF